MLYEWSLEVRASVKVRERLEENNQKVPRTEASMSLLSQ